MSNTESSLRSRPAGFKTPSWLVVLVMLGIVGFAWWQHNHAAQSTTLIDQTDGERFNNVVIPDEDSPTQPEVAPEDEDSTEEKNDDPAGNVPLEPASPTTPASVATPKSPISLRPTNTKPQLDNKAKPESSSERPRATGPLSGMRTKPTAGAPSSGAATGTSDRTRSTVKTETAKTEKSLLVENQTIRDLSGRIVYKGTIDLKPTLDRIERGEENRHRNDGSSFQNRENRLPRKPAGYYKEYVHPTKGENGPGPQRIIIGKEGEVWYTPDHYKSFKKIK